MMHKAWSSIEEVPYCFSRSSVKFQGHTSLKIVEFDPNWAFPDCNSSLNSPMVMKCCTKLETAKERCPIIFQGHPSNFMATRDKTPPILTQIGRFRTIGRSQLSNPSDCLVVHTNKKSLIVTTHPQYIYIYKYFSIIWKSKEIGYLIKCWPWLITGTLFLKLVCNVFGWNLELARIQLVLNMLNALERKSYERYFASRCRFSTVLTHCALLTQYGHIDVSQHFLGWWLVNAV